MKAQLLGAAAMLGICGCSGGTPTSNTSPTVAATPTTASPVPATKPGAADPKPTPASAKGPHVPTATTSEAAKGACASLAAEQTKLRERLFPEGIAQERSGSTTFGLLGTCNYGPGGGATAVALDPDTERFKGSSCDQCVIGNRQVVMITKEGKQYRFNPDARNYDEGEPSKTTFSVRQWTATTQLVHDYNQNGTPEILYSESLALSNDARGNLTIIQGLLLTLDIPGFKGLRTAQEMLMNLTGAGTIPIEPLNGPRLTGQARDVDGDGVPELEYELWANDGDKVCGLKDGCKDLPGARLFATYEPHEGGFPSGFDVWPTTERSRAIMDTICKQPLGGERMPLQQAICDVQTSAGKTKPTFGPNRQARCTDASQCPYFDVLEGFLDQTGNFFGK